MPFEWAKTKAAALKILGKDGDVPDPPPEMEKALADIYKAIEDFNSAREVLEKKILVNENANDGVKNVLKQFKAKLEKNDLGLDPKGKEDAKKILQARKILLDRVALGMKNHDLHEKVLDELDKHVVQLQDYKAPKL